MKIHKLAALGVLPVLLFAGCAATPGSSAAVQREVDTLKMEVADLKDGGRLSDMRGGAAGANNDMYVEMGRLRTDVQRLTESVETAGMGGLTLRQQLEYISARLDRLEKRANLKPLDLKVLAAVEPIPVVTGGSAVPPPPAMEEAPVLEAPPVINEAAPIAPLPPAVAAGPYDEGKLLFEQKNYREAAQKFQTYLAAEPQGSNASAAQFYVGESLYAQQQYADAILEYQKVVTGFPKSSQVPTSLLKQGISFQSMGDRDSAKLLYQKVVRDYPKSYAAGVAKERLSTL